MADSRIDDGVMPTAPVLPDIVLPRDAPAWARDLVTHMVVVEQNVRYIPALVIAVRDQKKRSRWRTGFITTALVAVLGSMGGAMFDIVTTLHRVHP